MSRRHIALAVLIFVSLISLAGMAWSAVGASQLTFRQAEIQDRLNRQLPRVVKGVTIDKVDVAFGDNRLSLQASLQGQVLRQPIAARISALGAPRYNAERHEIYFDADKIGFDRIMIAGKTIPHGDAAKNPLVATAVGATEQLAEQAIKTYLAAMPVYRIKDDVKGYVLKAALTDVNVAGDKLVVRLSLWKLTATTATFAFWLIVGLVSLVLLLRFPFWGVVSSVSIGDP
ncbi:MAG: DUF1439 domain-containing protein [Rhodoblastus sp.]|nr:DUF1439 domain-containing protein [Rhodoblastus sp.]